MGLTDALFTGTSGLRALGHGMSVIGDNVANLNTTAFKGARITFSDIMAQSINTAAGSGQLGRGAGIQALYQLFTQGAFESTASPTDMAIAGAGFFIVRNPQTTGGLVYTRDGQFVIDKEGYLVNPQGLRVQGWRIDEITNDITGALTDIRIDRSSPPVKTTKIDMITNLDARTETRMRTVNLKGTITDTNLHDDHYDFIIRDINGEDRRIRITLAYDTSRSLWSYRIQDITSAQATLLAENTIGTTATQATIALPGTKELIVINWSGVTHNAAGTTNLSIGGRRTARIETTDPTGGGWNSAYNNTWNYRDITIKDSNGVDRIIRLFLKAGTGNTWDYYVFQEPSGAPGGTSLEHPSNGTLLAKGVNYNLEREGPVWFFLNGTTERIHWDWDLNRVYATGTPPIFNSYDFDHYSLDPGNDTTFNLYEVYDVTTLIDYWNAREENPIPSTAYAYRSTLFVYDSLGTPHEVTIYYSPTSRDNVWEFMVCCNPAEDLRDFVRDEKPMQWYKADTGTTIEIPSGKTFTEAKRGILMYGRLEFDNQGNIKQFYETYRIDANTGALVKIIDTNGSPMTPPADLFGATGDNGYPLLVADFLGIDLEDKYPSNDPNTQGTRRLDLQTIELNFGYYLKGGSTWASESVRTTQYATSNATLFYDQNGFGPGALENISVDNEGRITGIYSNGRVIPLWMVGLANFNAPERLQKVGGNLYKETTHSGPPVTGKPGTNGLGTIAPNSIEQSNVDLGEQFVKMIIFQRGFQADARIITVSDTMLEELINLKR
ncbi:MAG: flagellar hook-basal body complex protein [Caldimicrobium sp.]|nr:flagellar hook-basal body complex protein [Caldimicrobium sp.]